MEHRCSLFALALTVAFTGCGRDGALRGDALAEDAAPALDGGGRPEDAGPPDGEEAPADAGAPDDAGPPDDAPGTPDSGCGAFATPLTTPPVALIVTRAALAPVFERFARLHTATGVATEVVTIETICADGCTDADPAADTAKHLKDHLQGRAGLKYVLLGGTTALVPARLVHDEYKNPLANASFVDDFLTDFYYGDLSEWDGNGDGVYAQDGVDAPAYSCDLAVARLPVATADEATAYLAKVVQHLTAFDGASATRVTLMSNVSVTLSGIPIDSAHYFEAPGRTRALLPQGFAVDKLYATGTVDPQAGRNSPAAEVAAFDEGMSLIVHSGHATNNKLTCESNGSDALTGDMVAALTNPVYPIVLSCGCDAGDIAVEDTAGERLVLNPAGGAISYLGNAPTGLGLAGGMQLIDELLRYVQATPDPLLADAYAAGHANLPLNDTFQVPFIGITVPVVDRTSHEWTQKAVVLLGDHLIPVWKEARPAAPAVAAATATDCGGTRVTFTLAAPATGTLHVLINGARYEVPVAGSSASLLLAEAPAALVVGLQAAGTQRGYQELDL